MQEPAFDQDGFPIEPVTIQRTCLPICMVDDAGNWVGPDLVYREESGRPVYRAMEGRKAAFLGFDWEALNIACPTEEIGGGHFAIVRWSAE